MRPRTQSILIGFLIVLLACQRMIKPATNYLMLPMGRILAFGTSLYVGLTVNPVIGLLMALVCLQSMSDFYVVEHLANAGANCECAAGYTYSEETGDCKDADGKIAKPIACTCDSGYAYDVTSGLCQQNSVMSSPIPATAPVPAGSVESTPEEQPSAPPASSLTPTKITMTPEELNKALGK